MAKRLDQEGEGRRELPVARIVCTAAVDHHVNEPLAVEMFTNWQIAAPRAGDMFPRCGIVVARRIGRAEMGCCCTRRTAGGESSAARAARLRLALQR